MHFYNSFSLNRLSGENIKRGNLGIIGDPTICSRDILCIAKQDYFDWVQSDQMVPRMIRWGRLVFVIGDQESQNLLKEDYQAWVHTDQMILVIPRREAGPCKWRPTPGLHSLRTLKWEAAKKSNWKVANRQPKQESTYSLSLVEFWWRGSWCQWRRW